MLLLLALSKDHLDIFISLTNGLPLFRLTDAYMLVTCLYIYIYIIELIDLFKGCILFKIVLHDSMLLNLFLAYFYILPIA